MFLRSLVYAAHTGISITVRGVHRHDEHNTRTLTWSPPSISNDASSAGTTQQQQQQYMTTQLSPYSQLRSTRTAAGRCATQLSQAEGGVPPLKPSSSPSPSSGGCTAASWCACSSLLYASPNSSEDSTETSYVMDTFALALFLSDTMGVLRRLIGEEALSSLVGAAVAHSGQPAAMCADPSALFCAAGRETDTAHWTARPLLTNDEENRLKWLREESPSFSSCYARAPTLRSMYVMWRIASGGGTDAATAEVSPTLDDVVQVCQRMRELKAPATLCDVAALGAFAAARDKDVGRLLLSELLELLDPSGDRNASSSADDGTFSSCLPLADMTSLEKSYAQVLAATLLCQYALSLRQSHTDQLQQMAIPPPELLKLITRLSSCHKRLASSTVSTASTAAATTLATMEVLSCFLREARAVVEQCDVPADSAQLVELSVWMLQEMPASPSCYRHFKRLVQHAPSSALVALEQSGGPARGSTNLTMMVRVLLPLLEHCGSEDFFDTVMRDVLSRLEDRLRRNPNSFTREDLTLISELGSHLFAVNSAEGGSSGSHTSFDGFARDQMAELHVMDGSPWALCVSSYRSLREMLAGLARDQRVLKRQVQEQMRSMGLAPAAASSPDDADVMSSTPQQGGGESASDGSNTDDGPAVATVEEQPPLPVSPAVRQRFLFFVEELVKTLVDEEGGGAHADRPIVVSSPLFSFVNTHVPVPNIQDEYRRKIFLLVNVAEDQETVRQRQQKRVAELRKEREEEEAKQGGAQERSWLLGGGRKKQPHASDAELEEDAAHSVPNGSEDEIPAELRFLVSSLPLTLSPWASVMILREVLAESAGRNPRYTYVLNAAIDLQLPISTTRSRIATTLNMWRFLNSQSHKLTLKESVVVKQRCVLNLPMSYILSSYWSLLTWLTVASIIMLNVVGLDFESQLVANSLFQRFAPWEDVVDVEVEPWSREAATEIASDYFEQDEIAARHNRRSTDIFLSSASYLFLGYDDQRRPMTIIPIGSDPALPPEVRDYNEYACAAAVLRELSLHAPFPFYLDLERPMPVEYVEMRIAERIRRVSFNNTWFLPRMIIRTFPLGRQYTERSLVTHTCAQANLTRRRITFLLYVQDGVPLSPQFLQSLQGSLIAQNANLVLVVHERSLSKGHTTPDRLQSLLAGGLARKSDETSSSSSSEQFTYGSLRVIPFSRPLHDVSYVSHGPRPDALSEYARRFGRPEDVMRVTGVHEGDGPADTLLHLLPLSALHHWHHVQQRVLTAIAVIMTWLSAQVMLSTWTPPHVAEWFEQWNPSPKLTEGRTHDEDEDEDNNNSTDTTTAEHMHTVVSVPFSTLKAAMAQASSTLTSVVTGEGPIVV